MSRPGKQSVNHPRVAGLARSAAKRMPREWAHGAPSVTLGAESTVASRGEAAEGPRAESVIGRDCTAISGRLLGYGNRTTWKRRG